MKELFAQSLSNELADSDRVASAVPGQVGAKNILFSKFWAQLKTLFGVNNWSAREYKSSPCIVVYNKQQYILDESVAPLPYNSTDFPTELAANIWLPLGGSGGGGHTIKDATTTLTQRAGLKFIGNVSVTDDSGGDNTVITLPANTAANTTVVATNFNGNLTADDDTAQKVAQKFDDYNITEESNLSIINGVGTIDLSKNRSYGLVQLIDNSEITIDLTTKKDQKTASMALFPNGNSILINSNINRVGSELIDVLKLNHILFGVVGTKVFYNVLLKEDYTSSQLSAPVILMSVIDENELLVIWDDIYNNYNTAIQISVDNVNWSSDILLGANAVSYTITGLTLGTTRYARVMFKGDGEIYFDSQWSNVASATTVTPQETLTIANITSTNLSFNSSTGVLQALTTGTPSRASFSNVFSVGNELEWQANNSGSGGMVVGLALATTLIAFNTADFKMGLYYYNPTPSVVTRVINGVTTQSPGGTFRSDGWMKIRHNGTTIDLMYASSFDKSNYIVWYSVTVVESTPYYIVVDCAALSLNQYIILTLN